LAKGLAEMTLLNGVPDAVSVAVISLLAVCGALALYAYCRLRRRRVMRAAASSSSSVGDAVELSAAGVVVHRQARLRTVSQSLGIAALATLESPDKHARLRARSQLDSSEHTLQVEPAETAFDIALRTARHRQVSMDEELARRSREPSSASGTPQVCVCVCVCLCVGWCDYIYAHWCVRSYPLAGRP
jgi:hypothetical protein